MIRSAPNRVILAHVGCSRAGQLGLSNGNRSASDPSAAPLNHLLGILG